MADGVYFGDRVRRKGIFCVILWERLNGPRGVRGVLGAAGRGWAWCGVSGVAGSGGVRWGVTGGERRGVTKAITCFSYEEKFHIFQCCCGRGGGHGFWFQL